MSEAVEWVIAGKPRRVGHGIFDMPDGRKAYWGKFERVWRPEDRRENGGSAWCAVLFWTDRPTAAMRSAITQRRTANELIHYMQREFPQTQEKP